MSARADTQLLGAIASRGGPALRILDLPAGDGHFSTMLAEAGHDVVPAELFPEACVRAPCEVVHADMNERLPFDDGAFDAIVCQEGIEHLENLGGFFRECRRVLRGDGHLFATVPNWMDISTRLAYLFGGTKAWRAGLPNEESTIWGRAGDRTYHGHAFFLPWFQIRYLLRTNQFDDLALEARDMSTTSRVLHPLLRWPIGWGLRHSLGSRQRRDRRKGKPAISDALRDQLYREGVSRPVLCGKGLLIHARLREGSY